ncbi:D-alanyl-D-alanine carboxypeptidase/D-alanyl-D-alanine-endopeptidase [Rhodoferax sp.]|uniref:D-alanyl-D-alanine carboxypeptidase/D-alanyl-D-alanine endopeptidase n=1 Tax=Rhodoferax sp. TaxID=50421 RepID=UPI00276C1D4D|nr:D-alanyl-D-alanine carboxypeptidase/D-alanyl-D-alanine-endopeptidase [Rhodoferax sp.]
MSCCTEIGRRWLRLIGLLATVIGPAVAQSLPSEFDAALQRAKVPRHAITVLVVDAAGKTPPRLSHRANVQVNPASLMKLVTTYAALDTLGPAYSWTTPVFVEGAVRDGTLYGNLYILGLGDPKLVVERMWLLLRRVQGLGVRTIAGDIVLDRSAFEAVEQDPAEFDGEPLRPYNAAPDALLFNFKSVVMTFVPDRTANSAQVSFEPPLAGVQMQSSVALSNGECSDYRAALKADFSDATRIRFAGSYPAACGEKTWSVAYADPKSYATRAVDGLWREMGGKLAGTVREGRVPAPGGVLPRPAFEIGSPTLGEVIRDINKYSSNVMAQQLFLTLSLPARSPGVAPSDAVATLVGSREFLHRWWQARLGGDDAPVLDNGSGLSRKERISASALARLLQTAYLSPQMPELMASLPISGVDGTLRRARVKAFGSAHLKTGSLRDVTGVAGYVHGLTGKRYVLVAIVNHPNANAARPAIDVLIDWATKDH